MGLDVYVGPLSRYYSGAWETIVQQAGREQGIPVQIVRSNEPPPDAITEPAVVQEAVLAWRSSIEQQLGDRLGARLEWPEDPSIEYVTDKPDWDAYGAVLLLAAHDEFGAGSLPHEAPRQWQKEPLYGPVLQQYHGERHSVRRGLARLFGRSREEAGGSPSGGDVLLYRHLHLPELWLPADFDFTFRADDVAGAEMTMGSVPRLFAELRRLNERTYRAEPTDLEAWRQDGPPEDRSFDRTARFGLSIFLGLAKEAVDRRLPMKLDY